MQTILILLVLILLLGGGGWHFYPMYPQAGGLAGVLVLVLFVYLVVTIVRGQPPAV